MGVMGLMLVLVATAWALTAGAFCFAGLRQRWHIADVLWKPFVLGSGALVVMGLTTLTAFLMGMR